MSDILLVPELLGLVLAYCNRGDLVRLGLVSQHLFTAVTPQIWNHVVCSPVQFLSLIHGAKTYDRLGATQTVYLPARDTNHNHSRLNVYANFIRRLELQTISPTEHHVYHASRFVGLSDRHILLPNLRTLIIETYDHPYCSLYWVPELFSPSLREIRFVVPPNIASPLTLATAARWLASICKKCPNITTLDIYPYMPFYYWGVEEAPGPFGVLEDNTMTIDELCESFRSLKNLRTLRTNTYMTGEKLMDAYRELPSLDRFEIRGTAQPETYTWVGNPFDSNLRHLVFDNLHFTDLELFYESASFQAIESFHLTVGPRPTLEHKLEDYWELQRWFPILDLPDVFENLTRLSLVFHMFHDGVPKLMEISEAEFSLLSFLPLDYLLVQGAIVTNRSIGALVRPWPQIREMHWPSLTVATYELEGFATLPDLTDLTLRLRFFPHWADRETATETSKTLRRLQLTEISPSAPTRSEQRMLARFLLEIWPNASLSWPDTCSDGDSDRIRSLSAEIEELRNAQKQVVHKECYGVRFQTTPN